MQKMYLKILRLPIIMVIVFMFTAAASMTLFSLVPDAEPVFQSVLDKYFDGKRDNRTLRILGLR